MVWDDRLVEVWAAPGRTGAGVLVGETGVVTVRHLLEEAMSDSDAARVLARVVRPDGVAGEWAPMDVKWNDERWDVVVLDVASDSADRWLRPESAPAVIVALGSGVEEGCRAVGFVQSEPQDAAGQPEPSPEEHTDSSPEEQAGSTPEEQADSTPKDQPDSTLQKQADPPAEVRDRVEAQGTVLPAERDGSPLLALDVVDAAASTGAGWVGMAGAGVVIADGRLIGLITATESGDEAGRLHVVPFAPVIAEESGFTDALRDVTGVRPVAQARNAPLWERMTQRGCLGEDGLPAPIGLLGDPAAFGATPATAAGEPRFLDYVARDDDGALLAALDRAMQGGKMLLVAGDSAAGKTRSLAHAVASRLPGHRLVFPLAGSLRDLPSGLLDDLGETMVWLDDLGRYTDESLADTLERLRRAGIPVAATMRLAELRALTGGGELRNPVGEALGDGRLVELITWPAAWSSEERARVSDRVSSQQVLQAVADGVPLGAHLVSGPGLLARLESAREDEANPARYALVRTVLDWYGTAIAQPIPREEARRLTAERLTRAGAEDSVSLEEAVAWALNPEPSGSSVAMLRAEADDRLSIAEYLLDHDPASSQEIPDSVWRAALAAADDSDRFNICVAAFEAEKPGISEAAIEPLARAGREAAIFDLGVLLRNSDPRAARNWYEQAAGAGDTNAMNDLGTLLEDSDPRAARNWYEKAADAGHTNAMFNLGMLLRDSDPHAARTWYGKAANAGHTGAMNNLAVLLEGSDPGAARDWWERAARADEIVGSAAGGAT